jgi:hypothetical protein
MNLCYNQIDRSNSYDFMTTRIEAVSPSSVQKAAKKRTDSKVLGLIPERDMVRNVCIYSNISINSAKNVGILSSPLIITKSNSSPEGT